MKCAKLASLLLTVVFMAAGSALAGDTVYRQQTTKTRLAVRHRGPFAFLGRVVESVLHSPQLLSEGMEGDRALVNQRGFLAPREVPVEDCILSPADDAFIVR